METHRQTLEHDWHPVAFAAGCGFCVLLLVSWFVEPTRSLWLALDDSFFFAVNRSLASSRGWQVFWAIANNRMVDIVSAFTFVALYTFFVWRSTSVPTERYIARGLLLTGLVIAAKQIAEALAVLVGRTSPTIVYPDAVRLSQLVPGFPTKDTGHVVFPGDHATILLVCAGFLTFYLPRRYAVAGWMAAGAFSTPRLVGGGHWLTDDLVGAVAVAGFILTYVFATPLHRIAAERLESMVARIRARFSTS